MAAQRKVYVGATLLVQLDCVINVVPSVDNRIEFKAPNGEEIIVPATIVGTTVLSAPVLLSAPGEWCAQTRIMVADVYHFGETFRFEVSRRYA